MSEKDPEITREEIEARGLEEKIDKRIGNRFWEARAKHGRDKIFGTPEIMWEAACEYFEYCNDHPIYEAKPFMSEGKIVMAEIPKQVPYTMQGLCLFLDVNTQYFRDFKIGLPKDEKDFSVIIKKIEEVVYNQKFSGAASGFFNANIIARDLGLSDRTDITTGGAKISAPPQLIVYAGNAPMIAKNENDIDLTKGVQGAQS